MTGRVKTYDGSIGKIFDFSRQGFFTVLSGDVVGGPAAIQVGDKVTFLISGTYYRPGDIVKAVQVTKI